MAGKITFSDLKQKWTPEIMKKAVELAGSSVDNMILYYGNDWYYQFIEEYERFPLLLHRAVEGAAKQYKSKFIIGVDHEDEECYILFDGKIRQFEFKDYLPCHLTACEMAIMDCLAEVLV